MDTEEDTNANGKTSDMLRFVSIIEKFPVLLEKSNIPEIKRKKANAIEEIKSKLADQLGIEMGESQISKKLNNLKARIKRKTDKNQTGNKKIQLRGWEAKFFTYMEGEINPSIERVKGAISAGVGAPMTETEEVSLDCEQYESQLEENGSFITCVTGSFENASSSSALPGTSAASSTVYRPVKDASLKNQKQKEKLPETNETRHLSTQELQRLVLLEQLQVFRLANEILIQKKQDQDSRRDNCDSQGEVTEAQGTTKYNLEIPTFFNLN
ncbi:unnamed protein product [Acanthoscelides obtectus]|uniref:Uncharacterized protein n=1 Tax=Acanthoscelides obtectus TaxID=200917 RepID=A0A9P0JWW7_ACAOB|nr:unnamed protein product [Acanthoscelides obtectus]CAK1663374.1 hypothetical protein AOBTE_LOCUS23640 [Acanthoscelides obtectus]